MAKRFNDEETEKDRGWGAGEVGESEAASSPLLLRSA